MSYSYSLGFTIAICLTGQEWHFENKASFRTQLPPGNREKISELQHLLRICGNPDSTCNATAQKRNKQAIHPENKQKTELSGHKGIFHEIKGKEKTKREYATHAPRTEGMSLYSISGARQAGSYHYHSVPSWTEKNFQVWDICSTSKLDFTSDCQKMLSSIYYLWFVIISLYEIMSMSRLVGATVAFRLQCRW